MSMHVPNEREPALFENDKTPVASEHHHVERDETEMAKRAREAMARRNERMLEGREAGNVEELNEWIEPYGEYVLLHKIEKKISAGGIELVDSDDLGERLYYRVLGVGELCKRAMKPGDLVMASAHAIQNIKISRVKLFLVHEEDVKGSVFKVDVDVLKAFINDPVNAEIPKPKSKFAEEIDEATRILDRRKLARMKEQMDYKA